MNTYNTHLVSLDIFDNLIHNSIIEEVSNQAINFNQDNHKLSYEDKIKKLNSKNIPDLIKWQGIKNKILNEMNPNNFFQFFHKNKIERITANFYQLDITLPYFQFLFSNFPHLLFSYWAEQNNIKNIDNKEEVKISSQSNTHNISFYLVKNQNAYIYISTQDDFNTITDSFKFFKTSFLSSIKDIESYTQDIFKSYEEDNYLKVNELFKTIVSIS